MPSLGVGVSPIWRIFTQSLAIFRQHWTKFLLLISIFLVIAIILGINANIGTELASRQVSLKQDFGDGFQAEVDITLFLFTEFLQNFFNHLTEHLFWFLGLLTIFSLSLLWLIRNLKSAPTPQLIKVKQAFYFGSAQIIPFTLLALLLILEFLPVLIVGQVATQLRDNGVLQDVWEIWGTLLVLGVITWFCLYWILGGLFSLIIVSLPSTMPWQAWQTSFYLTHRRKKDLVRHGLFIVLVLLVGLWLVSLPIIWLLPKYIVYVFSFSSLTAIALGHIYWFLLYRDLISIQQKGGGN
ncbi:MAG: hypothetical protein OXF49_01170 [Candidatus Saccharibacteria bacterium]|nr:hypothetical protein [Candidatus Saccharibacteria bacterium]